MIDILLPSLGPDMESGTLLEWRIVPGQKISKGTVIAVVDTDKAAIDVESWHEGEVAELIAQPGQVLAVGTVIARLLAKAGEMQSAPAPAVIAAMTPAPPIAAPAPAGPIAAKSTAPAPSPAAPTPIRSSPAARARAQALGIDLARIREPGSTAVITLQDVEQFASTLAKKEKPDAAASNRQQGLRQAIATAMARSNREVPHYYLWDEIDVSALTRWVRDCNAVQPVTARLLPAAVLLCAVARAAAEFKDMNGTFDAGQYHPCDNVHLGVAIALRGGGLTAPALRDAHSLPPAATMTRLSDLVRRARSGGLRSSEVTGQTITVTNLGDDGCLGLLGVIYAPQVALLGVGRITQRPRVVDGAVTARDCVTLSLAADHRVSDGRRGALFLSRIETLLQQPEAL
jgi:pyruvate dehydrogenase E2 component (dihydrolipoamide acetyltransferase)